MLKNSRYKTKPWSVPLLIVCPPFIPFNLNRFTLNARGRRHGRYLASGDLNR